jgi:uncharacterized membrane protein
MTGRRQAWAFAGKCLFAAPFLGSGVLHLVSPAIFLKIMPPSLPFPLQLVWISGVCEIALGLMLLVPRTTRLAAWGLIALLIAVFPANIYMYQHPELFGISPTVLMLRLPLQGLLVLWAYAYTGQRRVTESVAAADRPEPGR